MEFKIWYLAVLIAVVLNLMVSIFLFKREDLEPFQKGAQITLVWLIPYFAAIGLWLLCKSHDKEVRAGKEFGGGPQDSSNASSGSD